jgi:hypothetical protein
MLAAGGSAIWGLQLAAAGQAGMLAAWMTGYAVMMIFIDRRWAAHQQRGSQTRR